MVERFGPTEDGTTYYTLFNDGIGYARGALTLTRESLETQSSLRAMELLGGQQLPWTGQGWAFALEAQSAAVIRIDAPARFRSVEIEFEGRLRLTVAAPLGTEQVLESSTNLDDWRTLSSHFIEAVPMELPSRLLTSELREFYRLRLAAGP